MEPAAGRQNAAGHGVLAHQLDHAPARPAVRDLQVRCRPHHRPPRSAPDAAAPAPLRQRCRAHRGRHSDPTRDHTIAEQSKNYRYSTNHQVVIDADTRRVVVVGRPLPGNRNDCKAWEQSGAKAAVGRAMTIADGGYPGTGLVMPHRRRRRRGTPRLETRAQPLPQTGPRPSGAHLRPHEDLEDPPRLPPQGRPSPPRHAWHRPPAQPQPRWMNERALSGRPRPTRRRSSAGQALARPPNQESPGRFGRGLFVASTTQGGRTVRDWNGSGSRTRARPNGTGFLFGSVFITPRPPDRFRSRWNDPRKWAVRGSTFLHELACELPERGDRFRDQSSSGSTMDGDLGQLREGLRVRGDLSRRRNVHCGRQQFDARLTAVEQIEGFQRPDAPLSREGITPRLTFGRAMTASR